MSLSLLNFGCGSRIHPDWINIDFSPMNKRVKKVNLLRPLPYAKDSFDVAYSSHFLEHFTPIQALCLLKEMRRVLKPNGILRVVVPDLCNQVSAYLSTLSSLLDSIKQRDMYGGGASEEVSQLESKYDWLMLELFDQMVRMRSGGEMGAYFESIVQSGDKIKADFIKERVGEDLLATTQPHKTPFSSKITFDKIKNKCLALYLKMLYALAPRSVRDEVFIKTAIGERHKWGYDSFSLHRLLSQAGFTSMQAMSYNHSQIPHFNTYLLDINADGSPYKGVSSLYMEARS